MNEFIFVNIVKSLEKKRLNDNLLINKKLNKYFLKKISKNKLEYAFLLNAFIEINEKKSIKDNKLYKINKNSDLIDYDIKDILIEYTEKNLFKNLKEYAFFINEYYLNKEKILKNKKILNESKLKQLIENYNNKPVAYIKNENIRQ